jgi:hypothetical protein
VVGKNTFAVKAVTLGGTGGNRDYTPKSEYSAVAQKQQFV